MSSRLVLNPAGGSGNAGLSSGPNSIGPPKPPLPPAPLPAACGGAAPRPAGSWAAAGKVVPTTNMAVNNTKNDARFISGNLLAVFYSISSVPVGSGLPNIFRAFEKQQIGRAHV